MSAASRQRERDRFHLAQRRGFPSWVALWAWQQIQRANWCEAPNLGDPWSRQFEVTDPMVYPEPATDCA